MYILNVKQKTKNGILKHKINKNNPLNKDFFGTPVKRCVFMAKGMIQVVLWVLVGIFQVFKGLYQCTRHDSGRMSS